MERRDRSGATGVAALFYSLIESASYAATRVGMTRLAMKWINPGERPG